MSLHCGGEVDSASPPGFPQNHQSECFLRIIIIGAGEVGFQAAARLAVENKEVVVIDRNPEALKRVSEHLDVQTMLGSGSSPQLLEQAGVSSADILLAVTDSDEINLVACFFATSLAPKITKLARIRSSDYTRYDKLLGGESLGIDKIINPDTEVVNTILRLLSVPGAVEINEFADGKIQLVGIQLPENSPLSGVKLMQLPEHIGDVQMVVAALVRENELIIPMGGDRIKPGDTVYLAFAKADQQRVLDLFGVQSQPIHRVLIVGGGNIGRNLAHALDNKNYHTRLIDTCQTTCEDLSGELDRVIVLHGDGTDQELLQEENVGEMDLVVAVTGDEEMNILSCLLAKRMGARKTITRINNFAYMPLIQPIGIDHLVSPRLSAINTLLHHVRRGKVISTASIKGEEAEALEAIAQERSDVTGKAVKDIKFPKGALILCFQRGEEVIIPRGDTVIQPQDRLIILSTRKNIPKVEAALDVKVEFV